ncbi:flagellar basal body L-ring protein FlgH [Methylogaea oryzae]|uniref:Flagellar L-ring protein n=1 Tax=Methylogaea oryzae TaxID=1295382 RepID=A0A8D4VM34_9GAMM|nr:flagellar basal body L-ring protein FlgH [Methylogaea oryzae]BBL70658.1 flagellar L-ring protein [Methylogaea oryzae]
MKRWFPYAALLLLPGCSTIATPGLARDPAYAPARPPQVAAPVYSTGSIFQAGTDMRLFENQVARRVGDILTVKLVENNNAKKKADQQVKKEDTLAASAPVLFGQNPHKLLGIADRIFNRDYNTAHEVFDSEFSNKKNFKGSGDSNQSNILTGSISVTVVEVLSNGNLRVQGEKRMTINTGDEYVRLAGFVRPQDIDATNSILSTQIADATIVYTGEGALADGSRMGWLSRFFNSVFFPF